MRKRAWLLVAIALGSVMWITAAFWGSHSEGFQFVVGKIRTSQAIRSRVGNVRKVYLPVFGHYREKFVGSDKWVRMTIGVQGDKSEVMVRTVLQKNNGIWTISESFIGIQQINLN